jgi:Abnormal spindle-like microcephaly-assoc'd, ASPM-SPD-2-Hydin
MGHEKHLMEATRRLILLAVVLITIPACGGSKGGSPTAPTPTATRIITLEGNMAFGTIAVGSFWEATLRISNTGTEPLAVTGMTMPRDGVFSSSWTGGTIAAGSSQTATIRFTPTAAIDYAGVLVVNGNQTRGTNAILISGTGQRDIRDIPFRHRGSGSGEFFMPLDVQRVRIIATYTGASANFKVHIGWDEYVNERLGTTWNQTQYDRTLRTYGGGLISISTSDGVAWSFEEIR